MQNFGLLVLGKYIFITTSNGFGLRYDIEEVAPIGLRTAGVKAVSLKNDLLVAGHVINDDEYLMQVDLVGNIDKFVELYPYYSLFTGRKQAVANFSGRTPTVGGYPCNGNRFAAYIDKVNRICVGSSRFRCYYNLGLSC